MGPLGDGEAEAIGLALEIRAKTLLTTRLTQLSERVYILCKRLPFALGGTSPLPEWQ